MFVLNAKVSDQLIRPHIRPVVHCIETNEFSKAEMQNESFVIQNFCILKLLQILQGLVLSGRLLTQHPALWINGAKQRLN